MMVSLEQALARQLLVRLVMDVLLKANGHWAQVDAGVVIIDDVEDEDEDEDNQ